MVIRRMEETHTETFLRIIDVEAGSRVVTVIEFLSPTKKCDSRAQADYRQKQQDLRSASVSLVEIDLLRAGERVLQLRDSEVPPEQRAAYAACVLRGYAENSYEYYAMTLREGLKKMRIPLRQNDADAVLDIQALVDRAYENGAYDNLDYTREPTPPLNANDAEWAAQLLMAAGKR